MPRPGNHFARVFFEDGTVAHATFDAGASTVGAVLFQTIEEARSADRSILRERLDRGNDQGGAGIDDLRAVHTDEGTVVVPISTAERVVIEASQSYGAHWWTGLAARRGMILATNRDGGEVYLKQDGLFREHPDNAGPEPFPVTGTPWGEVDFSDIDSEHVTPDGLGSPAP